MSDIERVKAALPIEDVVESYVSLQKAGRNMRACCPFHNERTPSFYVTPDRGIYKCFGCGKGGDVISFVQEIENMEFYDALTVLADRAGIQLTKNNTPSTSSAQKKTFHEALDLATKWYEVQLRKTPEVVKYLEERGLIKNTMKGFRIGYVPKNGGVISALRSHGVEDQALLEIGLLVNGNNGQYERFRERVMFPLSDSQGRVVGFSGRIFTLPGSTTDTTKLGKYVNSPDGILYDKSKILYGYDKAKRSAMEKGETLIVEGQMDLVASHQAGTTHAVALSGTALTDYHCKLLRRLGHTVILALDGDQAGLNAAGRSVLKAYEHDLDVFVVKLPDGKDPSDVITENGVEKWNELLLKKQDYIDVRITAIADSGESDIRALLAQAATHVYPYLHHIVNPIIRDRALKRMSDILGVSQDAVLEDYKRWSQKNIPTQTSVSTSKAQERVSQNVVMSPSEKSRVSSGRQAQYDRLIVLIAFISDLVDNLKNSIKSEKLEVFEAFKKASQGKVAQIREQFDFAVLNWSPEEKIASYEDRLKELGGLIEPMIIKMGTELDFENQGYEKREEESEVGNIEKKDFLKKMMKDLEKEVILFEKSLLYKLRGEIQKAIAHNDAEGTVPGSEVMKQFMTVLKRIQEVEGIVEE